MKPLSVLATPCVTKAQPPGRALRGRRVVLVGLDWTRDKDPRLPLGQASLSASLRAGGAAVQDLSYAINDPSFSLASVREDVLRAVSGESWADLGIGVYVWNDELVLALCRELRDYGFAGRIILGGPQITYHAPGVASVYPAADVFVRGAGEEAIAAIVADAGRVAHRGVVWRGADDPGDQATVDLARAPSPYLTGVLDLAAHRRFVRWETKRGCPFRCSFCQHRDPGSRARVVHVPDARIRGEIDAIVAAGVESIAVLDPIFNDPRSAYLEVLDGLIAAGYRGRLSLQCRFEFIQEEFIARCRDLDVDLEFGLQTIHPAEWRVIQRGNKLDKIEAGIAALHEAKLRFEVSLIYGLPEQTLASFRATVDWCLQRRIPVIKAFPLMLLRGTELERSGEEWGLKESHDPIPRVVSSRTFTEADHESMTRIAEALIATEGEHPRSIEALIDAWAGPPAHMRWTPTPLVAPELTTIA